MPSASNAKFQYEGGQSPVAMSLLTNSGDQKNFTGSKTLWSRRTGFAPVIRPNGIITGGAVTPGTANDTVDAAASTVNLNGVANVSVSAATALATPRASGTAGADSIIHSITVASGGAYAVVNGTEGTDLSETRGAAGGPPYIPVDSIEVAQVRLTSTAAAVVLTGEIFAQDNTHREVATYPAWVIDYELGKITLNVALPLAHTGDVAKRIYASYAGATLIDSPDAVDFTPPVETATANSTAVYGGTRASVSKSLGQGSITVFFEDGITDGLAGLDGEVLWFKFFPDRAMTPHWLGQATMTLAPEYPADDDIQAEATLTAEKKWSRKGA